MEFGHFDDQNREFVITNPATPWPWINYLGSEDFFSLISNTAGGYSFYKDAKFRRITRYRYNGVPMDNGGRYFYINDGGTVWSPGWKPCKTPLDFYECRHGMGYTRIKGAKNGIEAQALFFVPIGAWAEIQKLTIKNSTSETKKIKIFSFQEWCLWNAATDMENFQRNFSTGEVEIDGSAIYHKTEYKERRNHYAYYSANVPIQGYDTDRESFIGLYNEFACPQRVMAGRPGNSLAHGWSPIASHYIEAELGPGQCKDFIFILGYAENGQDEKFDGAEIARKLSGELVTSQASDRTLINKKKARETISKFSTAEAVDKAFSDIKAMWDALLGKYSVCSSDSKLNRMVNIWSQYQCMVTFNFSRSASFFESGVGRGMGFRDSNQDLVGFVHQIPPRARERIIDIASTQFPDGGCYHQYQPLTKHGNNDIGGGFNDDPCWLIFGTVAYLKETGDFSILDEPVPFDNKPGTEASLFEHLRISFNHVAENLGPHMLPLIGRADWNDCLNLNCFSWDPNESFQTTENNSAGSKAESLMIAGLFVVTGKDYIALCKQLGKSDEAARAQKCVDSMIEAVKKHGWDGEWFLRAYDFYGNKIGSSQNEEGKIFIESQGWCQMAGIGLESGMVDKSIDACKKYLDSEHGMVLNNPAYTVYHVEMGEISSYPAGYKENAGIFCHNNPWVIIGETVAGRGNDAWELFKKIAPMYLKNQELHKVEPYVNCQMVAGKDAARPGEGKNSWLTGTAAWMWYTVSQYLLGIKPDYNGIVVDPCLEQSMKGYKVTRQFRGATYEIEVENRSGSQKGIKELYVNGQKMSGNLVPMAKKGEKVAVVAIM